MSEQAQLALSPGRGSEAQRTAKRQALILALENGHTRTHAADLVGLSRETFYAWLKADLTFSDAVTRAELAAVDYHLSCWREGAKGDWRASESWLSRRCPNEYAKKDVTVVLARLGEQATSLSDADLLALATGAIETMRRDDGVFEAVGAEDGATDDS